MINYSHSIFLKSFKEELEWILKLLLRIELLQENLKMKKIADDVLKKILEVGKLAPTAKNLQPQKIYVVNSKEGLEKIDKASPCRYNA